MNQKHFVNFGGFVSFVPPAVGPCSVTVKVATNRFAAVEARIHFMFTHQLDVRFRDCDPMGHTNNAVYLTYLEQTRLAHWRSLWGYDPRQVGESSTPPGHAPDFPGVILARVECDYKHPARYGDRLEIRMRVAAIGRTSFRYEYQIVDQDGRTVAEARTVQVMYDYRTGCPVPIPDEIRQLLQASM